MRRGAFCFSRDFLDCGASTHSVFAIMDSPGSEPAAAPEPASLWLAVAGCVALLGYTLWTRRRAVLLLLLLLGLLALSARAIHVDRHTVRGCTLAAVAGRECARKGDWC